MSLTTANVKTVTLLREKFCATHARTWPFAEAPEFHAAIDKLTMQQLIRMTVEVAMQRECVAEYPADWREALKERFAPAWLLRLWPVRKTRIDMDVLYPKVKLPQMPHVIRIRTWTPGPNDFLPSYSGD